MDIQGTTRVNATTEDRMVALNLQHQCESFSVRFPTQIAGISNKAFTRLSTLALRLQCDGDNRADVLYRMDIAQSGVWLTVACVGLSSLGSTSLPYALRRHMHQSMELASLLFHPSSHLLLHLAGVDSVFQHGQVMQYSLSVLIS